MCCAIGPMHYESVEGSGDFDTPYDLTVREVRESGFVGLSMRSAFGFDLRTGGISDERPGTWVYRRRGHYMSLRLESCEGFSEPQYTGKPEVRQHTRNIGKNERVEDFIQTHAAQITWRDVWDGVDLYWSLKPKRVKHEIRVSERARNNLSGDVGFRFRVETDIPRVFVGRKEVSWDDFTDEQNIRLADKSGKTIAIMPLDEVFVRGVGGRRPLDKRFYRENGQLYLFLSCQREVLDQLPAGDLIFDPAMTQEVIAADLDDGYEAGGAMDATTPFAETIFIGESGGAFNGGFRFTPNLPQGASLTGGGSEYASLRMYGTDYSASGRLTGTPDVILRGDDQDNAPAWADGTGNERPSGAGFTATTASFAFTVTVNPGAGGQFQQAAADIDLASVAEEIVGRGSWSANNGLRVAIFDNGSSGEYFGCYDYGHASGQAAIMDAYYTTGAAPAGNPSRLFLMGVG